jgi:hypothetical protein
MNFDPSQLNWKRILLVLVFVLVCLGLVFLMYLMFFKPLEEQQPAENEQLTGAELPEISGEFNPQEIGGTGGLPTAGQQAGAGVQPSEVAGGGETKVANLTKNSVVGMSLRSGGQEVVYFDESEGKFYRLGADGEKILLSTEKFFNVTEVAWANDGSRAILSYPDGLKIYYNFATGQKATLPKEVREPVFNEDGDNIVFKYETVNADNNYIMVSRPDGTGGKLIEPLGEEGRKVQTTFSPDENIVAFYAKPTGLNSSEIFFIGQAGENFKSLKVEGVNFQGRWSPAGNYLLYHTVTADNDYNPNLWLGSGPNGSGQSRDLGLQTWVKKCVFAKEDEVYCAVPENLPLGAGLYPELVESERDVIYKINLLTGRKQLVANPYEEESPVNLKVGKLEISAQHDMLFLWDEYSGKIYKMKLK